MATAYTLLLRAGRVQLVASPGPAARVGRRRRADRAKPRHTTRSATPHILYIRLMPCRRPRRRVRFLSAIRRRFPMTESSRFPLAEPARSPSERPACNGKKVTKRRWRRRPRSTHAAEDHLAPMQPASWLGMGAVVGTLAVLLGGLFVIGLLPKINRGHELTNAAKPGRPRVTTAVVEEASPSLSGRCPAPRRRFQVTAVYAHQRLRRCAVRRHRRSCARRPTAGRNRNAGDRRAARLSGGRSGGIESHAGAHKATAAARPASR